MLHHLSRAIIKRPDLSFGKDDANRFLPWIIGFLAFVTTLILAGWISLNTVIDTAQSKQSLAFTVTLPAGDNNATASAQKILTIVQGTRGVAAAEILSSSDMKTLVKPWLGGSDSLDLLPMPVMVEGTQAKAGAVDFAALKKDVQAVQPAAEVESQSGWMAQYASNISMLRLLSLCVAALFFFMMGFIVIFVAQTSVRLHSRAVEILHSVGALDGYIASQFQNNVAILTLKGACAGTFVAALLYAALSWAGVKAESQLLPHLDMGIWHGVLYALLPAIVVLISMIATRASVLGQLARRP